MSEPKRRGGQFVQRVTDVDLKAMTCTCPIHGEGVRLRVRVRKVGESYICRTCNRGPKPVGTKRKPRDPEQQRQRRAAHLIKTYGITMEEYEIRLEAQQGRCLLCLEDLVRPFVDHCHKLGHVRGLLCNNCNSGLGFFKDNPDTLQRAIRYLRRYRTNAA